MLESTIRPKWGNKLPGEIRAMDASEGPARVPGKTAFPADRRWFRHAEIANGACLVLTMGSEPAVWTVDEPPSGGIMEVVAVH
jgi:hypothetical protein